MGTIDIESCNPGFSMMRQIEERFKSLVADPNNMIERYGSRLLSYIYMNNFMFSDDSPIGIDQLIMTFIRENGIPLKKQN